MNSSSGGISPLAPPTQLPASNHPAVRAVRSAQAAPTGLEQGAHTISNPAAVTMQLGDVHSQLQFGAHGYAGGAHQPFAPSVPRSATRPATAQPNQPNAPAPAGQPGSYLPSAVAGQQSTLRSSA